MTKLENELGTTLEAFMQTIDKADANAKVFEIWNGHHWDHARVLLSRFREVRRVAHLKPHWFHFFHRWSVNVESLVRECVTCGKQEVVPVSSLQ